METKRKLHKALGACAFLALSLLTDSFAYAAQTQLHIRTGYLGGQYDGQFEGNFYVPGAIDIDYEIFLNNNQSWNFRFTQAMDLPDSRPFYTYGGLGYKYYFNSKGVISEVEGDGLLLQSSPRWRYYVGGDVGVAQVIVQSFGSIVQAVSSMAEFGAHGGAIYQVTRRFGIEIQVGATIGYGFSSVPALGFTQRVLVGGTYYF